MRRDVFGERRFCKAVEDIARLEGAEAGEPDRSGENHLPTSSERHREERGCNHCSDEHERFDKPSGSELERACGLDDRGMKSATRSCPEDDGLIVVRRESRAPSKRGGGCQQRRQARTKLPTLDE